jgi:hypothetical protein
VDSQEIRHLYPLETGPEDPIDWSLPVTSVTLPPTPVTPWDKGLNLKTAAYLASSARSDVKKAIVFGVDLGFRAIPERFHGKNYSSATQVYRPQVSEDIARLLAAGKIERVNHVPYIVHSVGAVEKKSADPLAPPKIRVIVDCTKSKLNECLSSPDMRLPSIRTATRMVKEGWYCAKYDLQDGFLQLPVRPDQCDFLGFQHPETGEYYRYRYMCFGLTCAPFIFQAVMQDLKAMANMLGIRFKVVYIDDWFLSAPTEPELAAIMTIFESLLKRLGWEPNGKKTIGPVQSIEYLGLMLDTVACRLSIPADKTAKAQLKIAQLLAMAPGGGDAQVPAHLLASVVGLLTHLMVISPEGGSRLRAAWRAIGAATVNAKWHPEVPWAFQTAAVSEEVRQGLLWWSDHLASNPTRRLWPDQSGWLDVWDRDCVTSAFDYPDYCSVVTTDAAGVGWGATLQGASRWAGLWSEAQATCSSNWRELKAVYLALRLYAPQLQGARVLARIDNSCAVSYVNRRYGRSDKLSEIARDIHALEVRHGFEVAAVHIAGELNTEADELSRLSQGLYADRAVVPAVLTHLAGRAGVPSLLTVMACTESALTKLAGHNLPATLWCPGAHEFFTCIQAVRAAVRGGKTNAPQVLLLPHAPHATWWGLLQGTKVLQNFKANTRLFAQNLQLPVPNSLAPQLVLPARSSSEWVAVVFDKAGQKRKRD